MRQTKPDKYHKKRKHESRAMPEWDQSQYRRGASTVAEQVSGQTPEQTPGLVTFYDAVFNDPEMKLEQKVRWLHVTASDYFGQIQALAARCAAAERVVEAARGLYPEDAWPMWSKYLGDGSTIQSLKIAEDMTAVIKAVLAYDATPPPADRTSE